MAQRSARKDRFPVRRQAFTSGEKRGEATSPLVPRVCGRGYPHLVAAFLIEEPDPGGSRAGMRGHGGKRSVQVTTCGTAGRSTSPPGSEGPVHIVRTELPVEDGRFPVFYDRQGIQVCCSWCAGPQCVVHADGVSGGATRRDVRIGCHGPQTLGRDVRRDRPMPPSSPVHRAGFWKGYGHHGGAGESTLAQFIQPLSPRESTAPRCRGGSKGLVRPRYDHHATPL